MPFGATLTRPSGAAVATKNTFWVSMKSRKEPSMRSNLGIDTSPEPAVQSISIIASEARAAGGKAAAGYDGAFAQVTTHFAPFWQLRRAFGQTAGPRKAQNTTYSLTQTWMRPSGDRCHLYLSGSRRTCHLSKPDSFH